MNDKENNVRNNIYVISKFIRVKPADYIHFILNIDKFHFKYRRRIICL